MCGRFYLDAPREQLLGHFQLDDTDIPELLPRYNIAPSQDIAAVRQGAGGRELAMLHWGLIPSWAKGENPPYRMINTRAETVATKPAFRSAFRQRRCLIPASGFYEWQAGADGKQPYCIRPADESLFAFAGLWEHWEGKDGKVVESCTILVTEPNELLAPIHDRMPVILDPMDYTAWLDPQQDDPVTLSALLQSYPADLMWAYPVSRRVNNPTNNDFACIEPA